MFEDVDTCALLQHLEHQIVKTKRNARRNTVEYRRIHKVNTHADEMRQFRLFSKFCHAPGSFIDHAKIHLHDARGGGDRKNTLTTPMTVYELVEVKVGKHVTVKNQERLVELLAQE